ncbi:hypothetical protein J6590_062175 [Homalodisca vitripennis]|nr:hypothetical protein J6590_062175 [Homalodisca vitripennis]
MDESDFVSLWLPQPTHFRSPQGQNWGVKFSVDFSGYDMHYACFIHRQCYPLSTTEAVF